MNKPFPNTSDELLAELERMVPELIVKPGDSPETVQYNAGRRSLVRELRNWRDAAVPVALRQRRGGGRVPG